MAIKRRDFLRGSATATAGAALGGVVVFERMKGAQASTVTAPTILKTGSYVETAAYIVFQDASDGNFKTRDGGTAVVVSYGSAASALAAVNTALTTNGGTVFLKGPCDYGSITWTLSGKTAVLLEPTVTGLTLASDGTWLGNWQVIPAPRPYFTLTPNGPTDGGDFGANS